MSSFRCRRSNSEVVWYAQAREGYLAWGAAVEVAQLDWAHAPAHVNLNATGERSPEQSDGRSARQSTVTTGTIDLLGILSASGALSSETSIERLHSRVVEVLSAMSGSTDVHLPVWSEDRQAWLLPTSNGDGELFLLRGSEPESTVPTSVMRYVQRTNEPLVVGDATRDYRFAHDPYFADVDCCSLLALPILSRDTLQAVLVLGNRLIRGAFSTEHVDPIKLIASQIAVALDNVKVYQDFRRIADEQAALRRVATLVAREAAAVEVFAAVASETKRILEFDTATLLRLEPDGMITVVGSVATLPLLTAVGDRRTPLAGGVVDRVLRTGRPARVDGFGGEPGSPGDELDALGYGGAAAAPVFVEGRLWGVLRVAWSKERSLSPGSEDRLLQFSGLIATALANTEAREKLRQVAEEQAALRRVATLVARGERPSAVFAAVAAEAGRVIPDAGVALVGRYDLDEESIEFVGAWSPPGEPGFVGNRVTLGGHNVATLVFEGNAPARVDRIPSEDAPATAFSAPLGAFLGRRADHRGRSAVGSVDGWRRARGRAPPRY